MAKAGKRQPNSNCYDKELRDVIAWRITDGRMQKFPGHGGAKKCAEEFGVSFQQWSQYENGRRTPDDERLDEIAKLFGSTLELLKTPPDDWLEKRRQWKDRIKPGRKNLKSNLAASEGDAGASPAAADAFLRLAEGGDPASVSALDLIAKLIEVQKKHERGEIPTPLYRKGMETVDSIITLSFGGKA